MNTRDLSKTDFISMLSKGLLRSEYVQTGESEGGATIVYWGLLFRELYLGGRNTITYCYDYAYEKDQPKSTLILSRTDDAWDLNFSFNVVDDNGSELELEDLIKIIAQEVPDITNAAVSDFSDLRDFALAFNPTYQTYSMSVHNQDGPIGTASEYQEGGAIILPAYLKGVSIASDDNNKLWSEVTGGCPNELKQVQKHIKEALLLITTGENTEGFSCDNWECREVDGGIQIMVPSTEDVAYNCFNFNYDQHIVDKGMLGLIATIYGLRNYCASKSIEKQEAAGAFYTLVENIIMDNAHDDRVAVELGDSMFRFTNNSMALRVIESMFLIATYG